MAFWSVAQTESQREGVAANFLKQSAYETYLPRIVGEHKRVVPLFPTYVFVRIVDDQWYSARWTIGVIRLLMWDEVPAEVSDKIVTDIMKREGRNGLVKLPKPPGLQAGQPVDILRGSFANHLGVYDGMHSVDRVRVLLDLLGRKVPVTLPIGDIRVREALETKSSPCA